MSNLDNEKKTLETVKMGLETTDVITTNVYKISTENKEKLDRLAEARIEKVREESIPKIRDRYEQRREELRQRITMGDSEQIHEITKLLALCWDENRELSFGEMIDHIFSFAKGHNQNEFWNMETKQCLIAIGDFREKMRSEREKYINDAD